MDGPIVCDTPEKIHFFRCLSLRGRLKLEVIGMKFRQRTGPAVKRMFGLPKGCSLKKALAALEEEIAAMQDAKSEGRPHQSAAFSWYLQATGQIIQ